ncbi:MAG: GDP-mannose 4,6-dehydratase [Spirochaetota bacterium]|nr:GDP-mannose 4,6-dehydratase [Spirochaetota bacterium]
MNLLVTGAAGFIGSRTAEMLLDDGNDVVGIDNLNDYYDIRLKTYRCDVLKKRKNFRFYHLDIEDLEAMEKIFSDNEFDAVINLAARAGVRFSMEDPFIYMSTNANGTLNILELMRKFNVNKMVMASTSSLYAGQKLPFKEDLPVNTPISPYAASKKSAEVMSYSYHYLFGIDISILRYFTVYGPSGRPDMSYFRFIKLIDEGKPIELFGDGAQNRDFTFIDDIAKGTIKALKKLGYEIINLGGGKNPITINYMISKIEEFTGQKADIEYKPFHKADMMETWADINKAWDVLQWKPEIDFDEGLKRTVDWYFANRYWLKDIDL